MTDIKGFCKLMDISMPNLDYFDYYVNQLSKTNKFKNIKYLVSLYEKLEETCDDIFKLKIDKSNEIIEYLKNTRAYNELVDDNLLPSYPTTKNFEYTSGKKYISIDISKANWVVLKKYDPDFKQELGYSYDDFLSKFDVPEIFHFSKQFRQYVFGNINPKRQGKVQRAIIETVMDRYRNLNLDIACIKNDEVIYSFDTMDQVEYIINDIDDTFSVKLFMVDRVDDFRVNTYIDKDGNFLYKEMSGCNGNLFYINLKKHILNEKLEVADLFFKIDGSLALIFVDGLNISL